MKAKNILSMFMLTFFIASALIRVDATTTEITKKQELLGKIQKLLGQNKDLAKLIPGILNKTKTPTEIPAPTTIAPTPITVAPAPMPAPITVAPTPMPSPIPTQTQVPVPAPQTITPITTYTPTPTTIPTSTNITAPLIPQPMAPIMSLATPTVSKIREATAKEDLSKTVKDLYALMQNSMGQTFDTTSQAEFGKALVEVLNKTTQVKSFMAQLLSAATFTPLLNSAQQNYVQTKMIPILATAPKVAVPQQTEASVPQAGKSGSNLPLAKSKKAKKKKKKLKKKKKNKKKTKKKKKLKKKKKTKKKKSKKKKTKLKKKQKKAKKKKVKTKKKRKKKNKKKSKKKKAKKNKKKKKKKKNKKKGKKKRNKKRGKKKKAKVTQVQTQTTQPPQAAVVTPPQAVVKP